ncbi:hypothetical protein [Streptococcus pseudopneumoniae]|uniref:hypothetical protein n=1 Tax=Streptococcus pseudopneumoniae TaxID=257758 RepID=UPI001EFBEC87|nr:hypothetical protein [Streptococcus pseudopneumoniae]
MRKSVPNQKNLSTLARTPDVPTIYFKSEYKIMPPIFSSLQKIKIRLMSTQGNYFKHNNHMIRL